MALNRAVLVDGAMALADAEGLAAVTIRRIARQHGVTATALYAHFLDKDELLDAMADQVLGEVVLPDGDLKAVLAAFLEALRRHPWTTELVWRRIMVCEAGLRVTERVLGLLHDEGYPAVRAATVSHCLFAALLALVDSESRRRRHRLIEDEDIHAQAVRTRKARLSALDPKRFPRIIGSAAALSACDSSDDYYADGLDVLINGVRRAEGTGQVLDG